MLNKEKNKYIQIAIFMVIFVLLQDAIEHARWSALLIIAPIFMLVLYLFSKTGESVFSLESKIGKIITETSTLEKELVRVDTEDAMEKNNLANQNNPAENNTIPATVIGNTLKFLYSPSVKKIEKKKKYLQIALNSTLEDAKNIISQLSYSEKIILEAGTPLIKQYGAEAIRFIRRNAPWAYVVADTKTSDLAEREVEMASDAGANAITCLGVAPVETINQFIAACERLGIDSMLDMMNVTDSLAVLKKLKKMPKVVMLHRGVDETDFSKEKQIPLYQIKQILGNYSVMISVAGGDTIREVQRSIFNGADIVVVWKDFMQADSSMNGLIQGFLKEIR